MKRLQYIQMTFLILLAVAVLMVPMRSFALTCGGGETKQYALLNPGNNPLETLGDGGYQNGIITADFLKEQSRFSTGMTSCKNATYCACNTGFNENDKFYKRNVSFYHTSAAKTAVTANFYADENEALNGVEILDVEIGSICQYSATVQAYPVEYCVD